MEILSNLNLNIELFYLNNEITLQLNFTYAPLWTI